MYCQKHFTENYRNGNILLTTETFVLILICPFQEIKLDYEWKEKTDWNTMKFSVWNLKFSAILRCLLKSVLFMLRYHVEKVQKPLSTVPFSYTLHKNPVG